MQVKSILQYFRPSLSYHLSLRSLFCIFLSGHFTQVLLFLIHRRKNKFGIVAALDTNGIANGELYWDDGEELGKLWVCLYFTSH